MSSFCSVVIFAVCDEPRSGQLCYFSDLSHSFTAVVFQKLKKLRVQQGKAERGNQWQEKRRKRRKRREPLKLLIMWGLGLDSVIWCDWIDLFQLFFLNAQLPSTFTLAMTAYYSQYLIAYFHLVTSRVFVCGLVMWLAMFLGLCVVLNHCLFCRRHPRMTVNMRFRLQKKGVRDQLRYVIKIVLKWFDVYLQVLFDDVGFTVMSYQTLLSLAQYQFMWEVFSLLVLLLIRLPQLRSGQAPDRANLHLKVCMIWYIMILNLPRNIQSCWSQSILRANLMGHVINILTMPLWTRIPRNTPSQNLISYHWLHAWKFHISALWDTREHVLLVSSDILSLSLSYSVQSLQLSSVSSGVWTM